MVLVDGGEYMPLYKSNVEVDAIAVESFWMDSRPVTNGEFLEFVRTNPQWLRSQIKPIFADETYLRHWASDLDLGPQSEMLENLPVVNISWFAARAYAHWVGKRLPTVAEWEMVGLASESQKDGRDEEGYYERILEWYGKPTLPWSKWDTDHFKNAYNIYAMHGLIWEWVDDFNTALVTGESRGDVELERNLFCGSGSQGSSDFKDYAAFMRFGFRSSLSADYAVATLGFRCVVDVEPQTH